MTPTKLVESLLNEDDDKGLGLFIDGLGQFLKVTGREILVPEGVALVTLDVDGEEKYLHVEVGDDGMFTVYNMAPDGDLMGQPITAMDGKEAGRKLKP